jgi:hypothetical protein
MLDNGGTRNRQTASQFAGRHRYARKALKYDHANRVTEQGEQSQYRPKSRSVRMRFSHAEVSGQTNTFGKSLGLIYFERKRRGRTMINGAHIIVYSRDAEADKAFLKNVLKFQYVDVYKGWLIFKLPPSEVAVHPSDENDMHEFYLMTDDLDAEMTALKKVGTACEEVSQQSWGRLTRIKLPGGGTLGLYQPRHERP